MPSTTDAPSRHDRVWLDPATWRRHRRVSGDRIGSTLAHVDDLVDDWIGRDRALVVRRRPDAMAHDEVALAIALSPSRGRLRIPLVVARDAVLRTEPPLWLDAVIVAAAADERPALRTLAAEAQSELRVYGSFAWQAIAGEPYVTPASDLDVLFDVRDAAHCARITATLLDWERATGRRTDGEARFANGDAIAWRELAEARSDRVLVKRDEGVRLASRPFAR